MARNLAAINQVRAEQGLPLLDTLPDNGAAADVTAPVSDTTTTNTPPAASPKTTTPDIPAAVEPSDDQILQALVRKGIQVNSIDELLPKPDAAKTAEQKEASKLSFALNKGLFTTTQYDNYVREKNNPRDLVYAAYHQEAKKEDPALSEEDILTEFEEKYGLNQDEGTRKAIWGQHEIEMRAQKILSDRYKPIFEADQAFAAHQSAEDNKQANQRKILAQAPVYKKDVEDIFAGLQKISIPVSDTESYDVELPAEALEQTRNLFLTTEQCADRILKGYDKEALKQLAYTTLLQQHFQTLAMQVAAKYHLARQAGAKGIPSANRTERKEGRHLTDNQKLVLAAHNIKEENLPPVAAN
jgi:hypothetical protein